MKKTITQFLKFPLIILVVFFGMHSKAQQNLPVAETNILVLHSYHQGLEWTDNITKGIQSVFKDKTGVNLIFEYLDTKRNFSTEYFGALEEIYRAKAKQNPYNIIITCDNAAYDFMRKYSQEYHLGIPIVFCGVNNLDKDQLTDLPNFYGFDEKVDYKQTLASIRSIFPKRKNVLIINDSTVTGVAIRNEVNQILPQFSKDLNFEFYSKFDLNGLQEKVKSLDDSYVIYLLVVNRDKHGNFITYRKGISTIYEVSRVPIFGSWDFYENKGLFGGKITKGFDQGEYAAKMAEDIIENGISSQISQYNTLDNKFVFDHKEMSKYDISSDDLPRNSIIINEPDKNEALIRAILFLALALFLIIVFLLVRLTFKKRRAKQLQSLVDEKTVRLREMNVALKDIITKKDRFLSIMSHDLRGPFNSMLGFAGILNDEFEDLEKEDQKKYVSLIYKGIDNTFKLLENLLYWSYTQSGTIEFAPSKTNVHQLCQEILDIINISADQKNINLINKIPESAVVFADKNMLSTIIRNLISNAIKFTPRGGEIIISLKGMLIKDGNQMMQFSVKDNGVGMSKMVQSKLFDMSEISSTTGTENETGTGLGLVLCKEFTDKHKGKIWVESEKDNGSEFIFTIPYE